MANVWGYWRCSHCNKKIQAYIKDCPSCGTPQSKDTKFFLDKENIEYVDEADESKKANWICAYCKRQNNAASNTCTSCGSPKEEAEEDYFGKIINKNTYSKKDTVFSSSDDYNRETRDDMNEDGATPINKKKVAFISGGIALALAVILFFVWLFTPIEHISYVKGFSWNRSISVEEYQLCQENDWTLPNGATLRYTKSEIHHYEQVIDHYETKTKQVPKTVQDGYETSYKDLGNGQFEEVRTPKYKTVYETESYKDPVYKSVPVTKTKYYYNIDRWKYVSSIDTTGYDKEPYWGKSDLQEEVSNPEYGDRKLSTRTQHYYIIVTDAKGENENKIEYDYSKWLATKLEDEIIYKTFRFSSTPL